MSRDCGGSYALCKECEILLSEVVAVIRRTRTLLTEPVEAAEAGVIDDLNFLSTPEDIDAAFYDRQRAREAYIQHRANRHS